MLFLKFGDGSALAVDDLQLAADKAAGVGLLDVIAGVDGQEEMVEEGVEVTSVEGHHGIVIFAVGLALLHRLCDERGIVVSAGTQGDRNDV